LHVQRLNYGKGIYELDDHVGEEALSSKLPLELGFVNFFPHASFPSHMLKNILIGFTFPYALSFHEGVEQDTI
jgi:hypothetical protein